MKKVHIVGIGGIGASGLAQLLLHRGVRVTGSDMNESEGVQLLRKQGFEPIIGHSADNVTEDIDVLIYSEAIPKTNVERVRAAELGILEKSYFEVLGEVSGEYTTIAIAGTHGKTTTVGLLTAGLRAAGFEPTVLMGAANSILDGGNFHAGSLKKGGLLIVEACEYRENFQWLQPAIVGLTNAEHDHPDSFPTEESYMLAMAKFVHKAAVFITHRAEMGTASIADAYGEKVKYADENGTFELAIPGKHNQANGRLALAIATHLGADVTAFTAGMSTYTGGSRRQERIGNWRGTEVYDDYGHHPTEILATVEAIAAKHPGARIGLIFEPHQHIRVIQFFDEFLRVFALHISQFGPLALFPIYAARDTDEDKKFTNDQFLRRNEHVEKVETKAEALLFANQLKAGDVLLFMGAGVIDQFAKEFLGTDASK